MKLLVLILLVIIIPGCNQNYKKEDLVGTWEMLSITDIETGEVELLEVDFDQYVVEIKLDSLNQYEGDTYAWKLQGDSVFVDWMSFKIKELKPNTIIVVEYYDLWGESKKETKFRKIE